MDLETKIGQLFFVGFEGHAASPALERYLAGLRPGGLIFFARNIVDAGQIVALNECLRRAIDPPPLIAVDQEGGRVSRLRAVLPPLPPAAQLANLPDGQLRAYGAALGAALSALGFNTDFAPVVDLSAPEAASGIGDRSFGEDAATVVRCARAFVSGLSDVRVASFLKHFPGLGATEVDSHLSLPLCTRDGGALWERDLLPFRAVGREAAGVMVAHAHYPAFDPDRSVPSSLSEPIVTGLLRRRMGYDGLALTDDLEMGAVAGPDPGTLALQSLSAGNDMVMFCNHPERALEAYRAVLAAVRSGRLEQAVVDRCVARIMAAKFRFGVLDEQRPAGRAESPRAFEAAIAALQPFATA